MSWDIETFIELADPEFVKEFEDLMGSLIAKKVREGKMKIDIDKAPRWVKKHLDSSSNTTKEKEENES